MKKKNTLFLAIFSLLFLVGCSLSGNTSNNSNGGNSGNPSIEVENPEDIEVEENTGEFKISSSDGSFSNSENIYTLISGGTYSLKGKLEGQIVVDAPSDEEVVIELNGVTISYDKDSPIKILNADKVEISAKKDTGNEINDNRNNKTVEDSIVGQGAIYAKCDLKLKGSGTLVVNANYNSGVQTSKDLTIQKLSLKVISYGNSIKGNNSVTFTSGTIQAYSKTSNGVKTSDNGLTSKNKQEGIITINGGSIYVDSLRDAFDASYDIIVNEAVPEIKTKISVKTGKNSTYYNKNTFKADSEKGLKALNEIVINAGTITVGASDDALHANYGEALENGSKGLGNITINGGLVQVASGNDGLHADNTLSINDGKVIVTNASEGFEANYVTITGGYSYIYGTDDGVNCSKKSFSNCAFTMSGGYLDIAISNGDTDGIDSNGTFTLSGGVIVTRGSAMVNGGGMSTGLDVNGACSMTGGTLIAFNGLEKKPSTDSSVLYAGTVSNSSGFGGGPGGPGGHGGHGDPGGGSSTSSVTLEAGSYQISGENIDISFTNDYTYGSFLIYSSYLVSGTSYKLSRNGSTLLSWTQSSSSVIIS